MVQMNLGSKIDAADNKVNGAPPPHTTNDYTRGPAL